MRQRALVAAMIALWAGAGSAGAGPKLRIASLDQCADQYVLALAPRDEILSLSKRALDADSAERALAVSVPERRASLETLLAGRPNKVVVYWTADARLTGALEAHGVEVVRIDEASNFVGVVADVRKVAAALGRPKVGEAIVARMDAKLAASHGAWRGARALYLTPGGFTAGPDTLVGAMMAAAGLASAAAAGGFAPAPLEALALDPPKAIVLGFFKDLAGGRQHWTIASNGFLQDLARKRAIASLPGRVLACPDWFAADGAQALASARPERAGR
jgi:iron complex transport system substrate-binding protein